MLPTLVSTWRKMRANEKNRLPLPRSHSEVIAGVRLHAVGTKTVASSQSSSVEASSSSHSTTDEISAEWVERTRARGDSAASLLQLKVFVGSWNMAAKDPFVVSKGSDEYMGDRAAAAKLETFLPPGYDIYVLGTQEKVTKHLHDAVLARLHAVPENLGRRFVTLRQATKKQRRHRARSLSRHRSSSESSPSPSPSPSSSPLGRHRAATRSHHGSFAVEASGSGYVSRHVAAPAEAETNQSETRESIKEVRGRGDGAFLSAKSTSIAVYCASDLADIVEIDNVATHKFSWSSGSKGGVAVTLSIATNGDGSRHETLTFANCHLEANKPALRRHQLATLSAKLGQALSVDAKDLASSCDHVVWMGDFNYRIHTLDGETVLKLLSTGKHLDMHDRYDSMRDDVAALSTTETFTEPTKWPTFFPTYKKIPGRPANVDVSDPTWPSRVYRVLYKEPFYKGGKLKARVPGWCDRILHCSRGGYQHLGSWLEVEQVDGRDNYRSVNDGLCESDHSPVFCTFDWTVATAHAFTWG